MQTTVFSSMQFCVRPETPEVTVRVEGADVFLTLATADGYASVTLSGRETDLRGVLAAVIDALDAAVSQAEARDRTGVFAAEDR